MQANKYAWIDALRGLAIMGVVLTHIPLSDNFSGSIYYLIVQQGARGVQLFFVASAFTLFLSFSNRINKESNYLYNFFIRRYFRIAPMYYLGIIFYLYLFGFGVRTAQGNDQPITIWNIAANFTFLHGINPYWINSLVPGGWSIAVEMVFYILIPTLFKYVKNLKQSYVFFIITIVIRIISQSVLIKYPSIDNSLLWDWYLFFYFPSQFPVFALGIIMYFTIKENNRIFHWLLLLSVMVLVIVEHITGKEIAPAMHIVFGVLFLVLGILLKRYNFKLLVNSFVNEIGKLSFSIYLVHFSVIYSFEKIGLINFKIFDNYILNHLAMFLIVLLSSAACASVFYRFVEVPGQNIGKKIIANREGE